MGSLYRQVPKEHSHSSGSLDEGPPPHQHTTLSPPCPQPPAKKMDSNSGVLDTRGKWDSGRSLLPL